jgi:hypothetical protein
MAAGHWLLAMAVTCNDTTLAALGDNRRHPLLVERGEISERDDLPFESGDPPVPSHGQSVVAQSAE